MRHTTKTLTALALLGASTFAQTSIPGPGSGQASFQRNFQDLIDAATTSYEVPAGNLGMSPTRLEQVSTLLLTTTGSSLAPSTMTPEGHLFYYDSTDASAMLHFDTNNSTVMFDKGTARLVQPGDTPNLPSESAAPGLALAQLDQLSFMPAIAGELVVEHIGGMGMGVASEDGSTQNFDKLRSVRFGRRIDGLRVMGPGSRMIVNLGEDAELQSVSRRWHEFDALPIPAAEKNTPEELSRMLWRRLRQSASSASEIEPLSFDLVLYDDGQGIAEPVIHFEFEMTIETQYQDATGSMVPKTIKNPIDFYVPILRQPRASLPFIKDLQASAQSTPADANEPPHSDGGDDE